MIDSNIPLNEIEIDTVVHMIKMAYSFENWEKVITLSENLLEMSSPTNNSKARTKKPIVYYFGYSHLMKGLALQKLKAYKESMECVHLYSDLSWVDDNQDSKYFIDSFQSFAKANLLTLQILMGSKEKLTEYLEFLLSNPEEILPGIITIIESALVHNFEVDDGISRLVSYISQYNHHNRTVRIACYLTVHYLLALYYCKNKKFAIALDYTLHNITLSDKLNNDRYFKKSIALFDVLKTHASVPQLTEYSHTLNSILKGEIEDEESFDFSSIIGYG